ncbi:hypothetical protein GC173_10045 [bacterium]|nr:hypothetical protein [bacterium]
MPANIPSPKLTWFPLAGALLIPAVIVGGLLTMTTRERQAEGIDISAPPSRGIQSALVEVTLIEKSGAPVVNRAVTFVHRQQGDVPGAGEQVYHATSDSAGVATISVPKMGMLSIAVDGMEKRTVLPAMEMHGSRQIRVRLTVDR